MSELMKKVYYNPSDPGFLGGTERLKHGVLQKYGVALKDKDVTDWLASQDAYTLHRTAPVKYKHNRVMCTHSGQGNNFLNLTTHTLLMLTTQPKKETRCK